MGIPNLGSLIRSHDIMPLRGAQNPPPFAKGNGCSGAHIYGVLIHRQFLSGLAGGDACTFAAAYR